MKVLVAARFDPFEPRPQPLQVLSTAVGLQRAGARVTVVLDLHGRKRRSKADVEQHLGQPLGDLDLRLTRGSHPGVRGVRRRLLLAGLARDRWDGVLSRDFKLTTSLAGMGLQVFHEWHSLPSELGQGDEGEERAAACAAGHVFVSQGLRDCARTKYPQMAATEAVLPNGCFLDPARSAMALDRLATADQVLFAGLFRQPTDAELLRTVAQRLPQGLDLVVAGRAPRGLPEWVHASGVLSPAQVARLLPGCLCQLALYRRDLNTEAFASPLKVVGAMASGVPLIATDLPTVRSLVAPGASALLTPPGNPDAVVDAIALLHGDRQLARTLAEAALRAAPALTWEARGQGLLELMKRLGG